MLFATATAFLLSSVCSAAILPRQSNPTAASQSPSFIIHSKPCGASNFDGSLGYLHAEYSYPPGYSATLHTAKEDAITGYVSDVNDCSNSTLVFPGSGGFDQGFKLYPLSEKFPNSLAQIYSGQIGTSGMVIVDGLLKWEAPDNVPVYWFACPNWALRWGPATALFHKWENSTTTEGCSNVDLVVEYV